MALLTSSTVSGRARLIALFVAVALALGGGGSPNPTTELILELAFVVVAIAWCWLPARADRGASLDPLVWPLVAIPLLVPVVQLIPLPPSVWTALPGRDNEFAALSLVGAQDGWRPLSLSPGLTLAGLLAIVPAAFCIYAVARLQMHERRLVLGAILLMAVVSALLGVVQLVAGGSGFNLYPQFSVGWVTGFQANRNAAADVLLTGILALSVLAAPYLAPGGPPGPAVADRRSLTIMTGGIALLLLLATVMTGSRAGTSLIIVAVGMGVAILSLARRPDRTFAVPLAWLIVAASLLAGFAIYFLVFSQDTAIGRTAARFWAEEDTRAFVWPDAWFALRQYWPVGFGLGGFVPAFLPAERLEYLDTSVPNRAHNDFLELGLEAGLLGYVLLAAAIVVILLMAWRSWHRVRAMRRQVVFGLGVLLLLALHSVVDYPLRSMALAIVAGVAAGMLARTSEPGDRNAPADGAKV